MNYEYFLKLKRFLLLNLLQKLSKNIDTRLEVRPIDLRRTTLQHIFKTRSNVLKSIREYFGEQNFTEINTPKNDCKPLLKAGAALFPIFYYKQRSILSSESAIIQRATYYEL